MRNGLLVLSLLVGTAVFAAEPLPTFDVNFVVVTPTAGAQPKATTELLREEVAILNRYFRSAKGEQLINFRFKSATLQPYVAKSPCGLVAALDGDRPYSGQWLHVFKACTDPKIRDPKAINFLVYDSFMEPKKRKDVTSKGGVVGGRPYVLIDWERLGHVNQSPEEHEMGHAFGLKHVCVPGAKGKTTPTNIMASGEGCPNGAGGARDLGFDDAQVATIRANAARYLKLFGPPGGGSGSSTAR